MSVRICIATFVLGLLGACASTTSPTVASNPQSVVCTRERVTGSHMTHRVCRTQAEATQDRAKARRSMEQRRTANTSAGEG